MMRRSVLLFWAIGCFLSFPGSVQAQTWESIKGKHFVVYYSHKKDVALVRTILWKSEDYYSKIAQQIGYARYSNFWTWDDRVKIIIFPDQKTFMKRTGQPGWSTGYADRDSELFQSRAIVTYSQEQGFLDGVLPHEIGHLILKDFVGFDKKIPLWFEEGVSQLWEQGRRQAARPFMRKLVTSGRSIPLERLNQLDIRQEKQSNRIAVFYAQSVSLVDYLLNEYGVDAFARLCRNLRKGMPIEEALQSTYSNIFRSLRELDEKWKRYAIR